MAVQGHFGKAAEACHVSQPALSAQIKKVEEYFQLRIFERNNRRVLITAAGEDILKQARVVLEEARKMEELSGCNRAPLSATLRMGIIATLGPYLVPLLLRPLQNSYPQLRLLLREGLTEKLLNELREGVLDVVVASLTFEDRMLKSIPLFFEPFILAVRRTHSLSKIKNPSVSDLKPEEMVLLEDGHCLKDQVLELCSANRRETFNEFHATSLETLRHLVASGLGYTLMPQLAGEGGRGLKELVAYRRFRDRSIGRKIVLVHRRRSGDQEDFSILVDVIRKVVPNGISLL